MTPYLPTPQEFLERPEPADDGDLIDPLVSIAASLAQLIDAMLYPLPGDAAAEEELAQNLRETAADLEDKLQAAVATLAQIEAVVKPSTSKLANAVRAELARWRGEAPSEFYDRLEAAAAEPEPEEPVEDQVGYVGPVASVPEQPAPDAPVEEWRAYVRARGYTSPHIDLLNRSQIRSMLGIPQPV